MKKADFEKKIIERIDYRCDHIEKLLTLSLLNDMLPQYAEELYMDLSDDVKKIVEDRGFSIVKSELFSDKVAIFLKTDKKVGIRDFREINQQLNEYASNIIFVYVINRATMAQKRKFIEERISFSIDGKEQYIAQVQGD